MGPAVRIFTLARRAAERVKKAESVLVVSHIDADGLAAAAIATAALDRMGRECEVRFVKQLDARHIEEFRDENPDLLWFTDLGSGMTHLLYGLNAVITDHHHPSARLPEIPAGDRRDILRFAAGYRDVVQVNPHLAGRDGSVDLSGAGATYLVARELGDNEDLSAIAVVGAVGDLQDSASRRLEGTNRYIMEDGKRAGVLEWHIDIRLFGRETRPVFKMLQYSTDPILPYITGNDKGAMGFLSRLGIEQRGDEGWRAWVDLTMEEKRAIVSALVMELLRHGYGHTAAERLVGEVYILVREEMHTPLRDAKEFATLLNACGRYGKEEVGMRVARGDRDEAYREAMRLLRNHRRNLVEGMNRVLEIGLVRREVLQYFHAGKAVDENIVGIIASMLLSSEQADSTLPIIGFAVNEDGDIKVSARAPRELVDAGLDLSVVMRECASVVGGFGGGHNVAAGATIPSGKEEEFLDVVEEMIRRQLGG